MYTLFCISQSNTDLKVKPSRSHSYDELNATRSRTHNLQTLSRENGYQSPTEENPPPTQTNPEYRPIEYNRNNRNSKCRRRHHSAGRSATESRKDVLREQQLCPNGKPENYNHGNLSRDQGNRQSANQTHNGLLQTIMSPKHSPKQSDDKGSPRRNEIPQHNEREIIPASQGHISTLQSNDIVLSPRSSNCKVTHWQTNNPHNSNNNQKSRHLSPSTSNNQISPRQQDKQRLSWQLSDTGQPLSQTHYLSHSSDNILSEPFYENISAVKHMRRSHESNVTDLTESVSSMSQASTREFSSGKFDYVYWIMLEVVCFNIVLHL